MRRCADPGRGTAEGAEARGPPAAPDRRDNAQGIGLFCSGGARPPVQAMIAFIDDQRAVHGVEPHSCRGCSPRVRTSRPTVRKLKLAILTTALLRLTGPYTWRARPTLGNHTVVVLGAQADAISRKIIKFGERELLFHVIGF